MTCSKFSQSTLSDYTDHELGPFREIQVRLHLRTCEECAHEVRQLLLLNETAQSVYVGSAQPRPTMSAIRPLAAVALVLAGILCLIPEMTGHSQIAFADVENAMRQIKTASYTSRHIVYDVNNKREEEIQYQHWISLAPLMDAWESHLAYSRQGKHVEYADTQVRTTEFESVLCEPNTPCIHIVANAGDRAKGKRIPVELNIKHSLFPQESLSDKRDWHQETIHQNGLLLIHLYSVLPLPKYVLHDDLWVDPATKRLYRSENRHEFFLTGKDGKRRLWRTVVNVSESFRYNEPIPEKIFLIGQKGTATR